VRIRIVAQALPQAAGPPREGGITPCEPERLRAVQPPIPWANALEAADFRRIPRVRRLSFGAEFL
jgi:hypothetical protein